MALHFASRYGQVETVKFLLDEKAELNAKLDGGVKFP